MDDFFRAIFPPIYWTPRIPRPLPSELLWPPEEFVETSRVCHNFWGVKNPKDLGTFSQGTPPRMNQETSVFWVRETHDSWGVTPLPIGEKKKTNTRARLLAWYCSRKTPRHLLVLTTLYVSYEHNPGQNSLLSIRDESDHILLQKLGFLFQVIFQNPTILQTRFSMNAQHSMFCFFRGKCYDLNSPIWRERWTEPGIVLGLQDCIMSFEYVYQKTAPATMEIQHTLLGTSGPYPILWKRDPTINLLQALRVGGICDHFLESTPQKSNIDRPIWQLRQPAPPLESCMPKFERKNKSYLLNSPVVSKMYPWGRERFFFFLHCRASAKHSRSPTGNMKWTGANWVQNFHKTIPKKQTNTNKNTTQPTKQTKTNPQGPVKFRKKMWDKGETTCPSQPLMRKYCFFQCISFQVRLFWVSMSLFGGVFCQILYRFIGKIKAIVTFWSGFSTINIQVLRQNAWGSSPQKVALQKRPQRIPLIKPSSKNRQN